MSSSARSGSYPHELSHLPPGPTGLVVQGEYGTERLVFTDQQLCDDLIATIPKLHDAVRRDMRGDQWTPANSQHGVEKYELVPIAGGADDIDIVHAVVAKTELKCHMNEVLNVLVHQDSSAYDATMKALGGKKFAQGNVLFQQRCKLVADPVASSTSTRFSVSSRSGSSGQDAQSAQSGLISVKLATIKPKFGLHFSRKVKRTQRLCFATFTHKYASKDRAVHIIKTLPKRVHDQVVPESDRSALRHELDHLAVGFDIQFAPSPGGGSVDQTTRILAHGYASTAPADAVGTLGQKAHRTPQYSAAELAKRRATIMNPEAKHVLSLLTDSLTQFERVIRRRRLGLQSFVYFPKGYDDPALVKSCAICAKGFKFYRRDFFCQLCGQMACGECSALHDVEHRPGELRRNRVCLTCTVRVDKCIFDDEDVIAALGPVVVDASEREWFDDDRYHLELAEARSETVSVTSSNRSSYDHLTDQLYSDDPSQWSAALETLGQLVSPTAKYEYTYVDESAQRAARNQTSRKSKTGTRRPKTREQQVRQDVENHLSYSLRVNRDKYKTEDLAVASKERDNKLEFDASKTMFPDQPLAPRIDAAKDARRAAFIKKTKLLEPEQDLAALNMIAQVAAKRMNCPVGYISVIDDTAFHAVASFPQMQLPPMNKDEVICAHTLYEEKPLIVNPMRDVRFRNVPMARKRETKFYAGFPIRAPDGQVFATLCTSDYVAHNHITAKEYATMESLAQLVSDLVTHKVAH